MLGLGEEVISRLKGPVRASGKNVLDNSTIVNFLEYMSWSTVDSRLERLSPKVFFLSSGVEFLQALFSMLSYIVQTFKSLPYRCSKWPVVATFQVRWPKSKKQSGGVVKYTFLGPHLLCWDPNSATRRLCDLISLQLRWLTCKTHTTAGPAPWKGWGRSKRSQLERRLPHSTLSGVISYQESPDPLELCCGGCFESDVPLWWGPQSFDDLWRRC